MGSDSLSQMSSIDLTRSEGNLVVATHVASPKASQASGFDEAMNPRTFRSTSSALPPLNVHITPSSAPIPPLDVNIPLSSLPSSLETLPNQRVDVEIELDGIKGIHSELKKMLWYMLIHAMSIGVLALAVPALWLRLNDNDSSRAAWWNTTCAVITGSIGFIIYPILSMASDHYGRRPFIIWTLFGTILAFTQVGVFNSIPSLVAASVIRGVCDVGYAMVFAVLGDVTPKKRFIKDYSFIQAASGVGFVIGPVFALVSMQIEEYRLPFFLLALFETENLIYVWFFTKETLFWKEKQAVLAANSAADSVNLPRPAPILKESFTGVLRRRTLNPFKSLIVLNSSPSLLMLSLALACNMMAFSGQIAVYFLFTHEKYGWTSEINGGFMALLGCCLICANAVVLPFIQKRWKERSVILFAMVSALCFQTMFIVIPREASYALFGCIVVFQGAFVLTSNIRALISRQITSNRQGELQGGLTCIVSLASIAGPLVLGSLFAYFSSSDAPFYLPSAPFVMSLLLYLVVASLLWGVYHFHAAEGSVAYAASPTHGPPDPRSFRNGALAERIMRDIQPHGASDQSETTITKEDELL